MTTRRRYSIHRVRFTLSLLFVVVTVTSCLTYANASTIRAVLANWTANPPPQTTSNGPFRWKSFEAMHSRYEMNFVESEGFGMSRVFDYDAPEDRLINVAGVDYAVNDFNLLAYRQDNLIAYQASWLNLMRNQLDHYQTRAVSEWENDAWDRLRVGADVVWDMHPDKKGGTVLAALRAKKSCASCHEVEPGTLLGAFAYELVPGNANKLAINKLGL